MKPLIGFCFGGIGFSSSVNSNDGNNTFLGSSSVNSNKKEQNNEYEDNIELEKGANLTDEVVLFYKCKINCFQGNTNDWVSKGIFLANIAFFFTGDSFDYPEHWFLIARTRNNKSYLLEKGNNGKKFKFYKNIYEIIDHEQEVYSGNSVKMNEIEIYVLKETVTLNNLIKFYKKIPKHYNLIYDNCQDFVRLILDHFNTELKTNSSNGKRKRSKSIENLVMSKIFH